MSAPELTPEERGTVARFGIHDDEQQNGRQSVAGDDFECCAGGNDTRVIPEAQAGVFAPSGEARERLGHALPDLSDLPRRPYTAVVDAVIAAGWVYAAEYRDHRIAELEDLLRRSQSREVEHLNRAFAAETERDAALRLAQEANDDCRKWAELLQAAKAERDAAVAMIERAPHTEGCRSLFLGRETGKPCDCWKSSVDTSALAVSEPEAHRFEVTVEGMVHEKEGQRESSMSAISEPTQPGWYATAEGVSDWMLYSLDTFGNWSAHILNGEATPCVFGYIDQAGPLRLVAAYPRPEVSAPELTPEQLLKVHAFGIHDEQDVR